MGSAVDKINAQISRDYPFYKGVKPKVSERGDELLLVYEKNERTEDGLSLPMQLRVRADSSGKIKSVSGSR
ncbi:MAG: hypothetical protein IKP86_02460 [Anaerolineaceae bacterium]|nr:hypothetical protein [Anaerolineaceae bacterium]